MASIPLHLHGRCDWLWSYEAAGLAIPLTFLKFSRGFEAEADYLGVEYMYRAGYDPSAFVSFFEKIQAMEKKKPGTLSKAFDTHPQTPDRIEKSQEEIRKILPVEAAIHCDHLGVRRGQGAAGGDREPAQGARPERCEQAQLAADFAVPTTSRATPRAMMIVRR